MTIKWMLHRITHRKRTYILLGLMLIGFSITGGVTKYYSTDHELMVLNMAFATNFDTMNAWQSWHMRWQYTWLVSAISMTWSAAPSGKYHSPSQRSGIDRSRDHGPKPQQYLLCPADLL